MFNPLDHLALGKMLTQVNWKNIHYLNCNMDICLLSGVWDTRFCKYKEKIICILTLKVKEVKWIYPYFLWTYLLISSGIKRHSITKGFADRCSRSSLACSSFNLHIFFNFLHKKCQEDSMVNASLAILLLRRQVKLLKDNSVIWEGRWNFSLLLLMVQF